MPLPPSIKHVCGLVACLVIVSCAQMPAHAAYPDKDAAMNQTTPSDGEASANAVAAQLNRIAAESVADDDSSSDASPARQASLPTGPTLATRDWIARALQLIDNLKTQRDTQPSQVAQVLGLPSIEHDSAHAATGPLTDGGTYSVWSNALYRQSPDKWTVSLSQGSPETAASCIFPLETLREHMRQRGYKATEGVRRRDGSERVLFRSPASREGLVFVVEAKIQGTPGGTVCIQEIRIDANTAEDEA